MINNEIIAITYRNYCIEGNWAQGWEGKKNYVYYVLYNLIKSQKYHFVGIQEVVYNLIKSQKNHFACI